MNIRTIVVGQMQTNCYLVYSGHQALIVDPGDDAEYIISTLTRFDLTPELILATHGHFDHLMAAYELQTAYNIPFMLSEADKKFLNRHEKTGEHFLNIKVDPAPHIDAFLSNSYNINLNNEKIDIVETPGHTPGGVSFYSKPDNWIISGDVVFSDGYIGRTDFLYSNQKKLGQSLKKILSYSDETLIYPGHGESITASELK